MKRSVIPAALLIAGTVVLGACGSSSKSTSSPTSGSSSSPTSGSSSPTSGSSSPTSGSSSPTSGSSTATTSPKTAPVIHAQYTLTEDGSSLLFPFLEQVASQYHSANPAYAVNTGAGGSGLGISDAAAGNSSMGGSDAYLSPEDFSKYPGLMNIPVAVSSQCVDYNLPGIKNLKLSGTVLDGIYTGKITKWNDSAIKALNPGVNLPSMTIVPFHREDSSGDTFLFTSFLTATNPSWASSVGEDTTVTWPNVSGEGSATGNPGMVQAIAGAKGGIGYVGISAQSKAVTAGLEEAQLQNAAGNYEQPSSTTVLAAVAAGAANVPANLVQSLIDTKGTDAYPIVNFEYIIVKTTQSSSSTAMAIQKFLNYVINTSEGSSAANLAKDQFEALPTNVVPKVQAAIAKITG